MTTSIHPAVDGGVRTGAEGFSGGTLRCLCTRDPVEVKVGAQVAFNHACGCTKCWKPAGAVFSVVGVVPRDKVSVSAHGEKLKVVDDKALIQRRLHSLRCTPVRPHREQGARLLRTGLHPY